MSVCSALSEQCRHPAGELGREPCESPRCCEEASTERASTERASTECDDASEGDGPRACNQRIDREHQEHRGRLNADHIEAIYTVIYAGVGNRPEAEELTTRVLAIAEPCLVRCTPDETLGLLVRVARSVVDEYWQTLACAPAMVPDRRGVACHERACRNTAMPPTVDTALPTPAQRADRILGLLPAREREVLTYRFLQNRSVQEIADMLLLTEDAVKALVYRALKLAADFERTML